MRKINVKLSFSRIFIFEHNRLESLNIKLISYYNYLEYLTNTCNLGHLVKSGQHWIIRVSNVCNSYELPGWVNWYEVLLKRLFKIQISKIKLLNRKNILEILIYNFFLFDS